MTLPFFLIYLTSYFGISAGIYGLFTKAGETIKDDTKKSVSKWLQNIELDKDAPNWPDTFASLFDRVFTERHFSWKCFRRSSIASVFGVIIMSLIYFTINYTGGINDIEFKIIDFLKFAPVLILILNLIPDYISLLESRYILKKMKGTQSVVRLTYFLTIDFLVTGIIFIIFSYIDYFLIYLTSFLMGVDFRFIGWITWLIGILNSVGFSGGSGLFGVFFYSTYFTSVWIWLYAGSGILIKLIVRAGKFLLFFRKHLNIEREPFKSMGFVIIILISFAYLIGAVIMLIT